MKLEVGMYVRYVAEFQSNDINKKIIKIGKIIKIEDDYIELDSFNNRGMCPIEYFTPTIIGKPNYNIIDLIEYWVLLYVDISPDDCGGIVIPMVLSTSAELDSFKKNIKNGRYILKGIVTKKILDNNCYEIGDE